MPARRPMGARSRCGPKKSRPAQSRHRKCKLEANHDHAATFRSDVPASALADGAHDHCHFVHRRRHGRLGLSTLRPSGLDPSAGGIAILVLCVVRIVNRFINPPPDLPDTVPSLQRVCAKASHIFLYALMLVMPLVGWGMLSVARYPIVLYGPV